MVATLGNLICAPGKEKEYLRYIAIVVITIIGLIRPPQPVVYETNTRHHEIHNAFAKYPNKASDK
jgi:hypothetical protein